MTEPTAPSSWGMTNAEMDRFVQEMVGTPAPEDNEWRPAGGSILGGIGQCLYDELRGIYDLTKLMIEVSADLDIAADGDDDWWLAQNIFRDAAATMVLFGQLESGSQQFSALPEAQRMALFRLYAKFEAVKQALISAGKAGLNVIAAYDVYWSEYEVFTLNQAENALKGLADAISLLFTEEEWAAMAGAGRALANKISEMIQKQVGEDPWGSGGYAACLVVLILSPTKVIKAVRLAIGSLGSIGRASTVAELAAALSRANVRVPTWLGGADEAADAARGAERVEDAVPPARAADDATPPATAADEATPETNQPIESADDANPVRAENPSDRTAAEPDADTTHVKGKDKKAIGDLAEADARARLEAEGFKTFELKNGSGHGPDIIAIKPGSPPQIRVIEVKANGSTLNPLQEMGGPEYLKNVFGRIDALPNGGTWNTAQLQNFLRRNGNLTREDLLAGDFEIWRYKGVDPDNPASVNSGPSSAPWTPGTTGREFKLDSDGSVMSRSGPNRKWVHYVEPDEYAE